MKIKLSLLLLLLLCFLVFGSIYAYSSCLDNGVCTSGNIDTVNSNTIDDISNVSNKNVSKFNKIESKDNNIKKIVGQIIDIDQDKKNVTIKKYISPNGLTFNETVYDQIPLFFDNRTVFSGNYYFKDYYSLQVGQIIKAKYKTNTVGENIVKEIKLFKNK